ncbi:cysteine desulfurase family protein [Formosa algae]|uniref:cysteine desulfurase family protein n=1 Tax=Formosa algae TaxID=225843 RepID=UPI001E60DA2D|nr:cysteine desulfurase family protein [Formosa algae]
MSYLDTASTTKIDQRVLDEMLPYFTEFYGNASSSHKFGEIAKQAIDRSRIQVANIINCDKDEIIFTSGSTESINLAIKGYVESNQDKGNHIITVQTEHKAVLSTCEYLETKGYEVTYLDVDESGLISLEQLRESVKKNTLIVVIMYINNETGVIQPIRDIGKLCNDNNIAFFCDATQAVGKINVDIEEDQIDMLCFSGHKLNGPKGIGALYKREGIELTPLIHGGGQEGGLRGGTYNTPLIVGLGKACEVIYDGMDESISKIESIVDYFISSLKNITNCKIISERNLRSSNIVNIIIENLDSNVFIGMNKSIALSNGSACNSGVMDGSHVLKAMNITNYNNYNNIRVSIDKCSSKADVDALIQALRKTISS